MGRSKTKQQVTDGIILLTIEVKQAEKDIIGSKQVGSKEGYHGYGQDIPIMEDYIKHKKGDIYIEVTEKGFGEFARHFELDELKYVLHDVVAYMENQGIDCDELSATLETEPNEKALKQIRVLMSRMGEGHTDVTKLVHLYSMMWEQLENVKETLGGGREEFDYRG